MRLAQSVPRNLKIAGIFDALKHRYVEEGMYGKYHDNASTMKQKETQWVSQYEFQLHEAIDIVNALADSADMKISESMAKQIFIRGLRPELRGHLEFFKPTDIYGAITKAKEVEHSFGIKPTTATSSKPTNDRGSNSGNHGKGKTGHSHARGNLGVGDKKRVFKGTCHFCGKEGH